VGTETPCVVVLGPAADHVAGRTDLARRLSRQLDEIASAVIPVSGPPGSAWVRVAEAIDAAPGSLGVVDATYVGHASPLGDTIADSRLGTALLMDRAGVRGVLRIGPADLGAAHDAAVSLAAVGAPVRTAELADRLAAAGIELRLVGPHPYEAGFADDAAQAQALLERTGHVDEHRLRLVASARPGDGFYSTFVLRRASRHLTALALRLRLRPDTITVLSLLIGLAAAVSFAVGAQWALVAGAVLLQVSLVVDCVDGEVARYTRRFTAFGAWLDGVADRVKEFAVYAGLAVGAARFGGDVWLLAGAAMALLVARHHVDFGFSVRQEARAADTPQPGPADRALPRIGRGAASLSDRTNERPAVRWAKRVIVMPIGERWLIISVVAVLWGARAVLVVLLATGAIAAIYTTVGRVLRSHAETVVVDDAGRRDLALLTDIPLLVPARPPPQWMGARLAWLGPAAARSAEFGGVLGVAAVVGGPAAVAAYVVLAAVALHLYDLVYRLRHLRRPPAAWATVAGLGAVGRSVVVVLAAAAGSTAFAVVCVAVAALVIAVSGLDGGTAWAGDSNATGPRVAAGGTAR
jgi:phosphatidylglycerophosphate synthase